MISLLFQGHSSTAIITDKGLDLSSLLFSCFRTEIYSSLPPMSPLSISGIPPSIATKPLQPGAQQLLPQTVDAKESSLGTGGSTIRSCSRKAAPSHKPSNCSSTLGAIHNLHTMQGTGLNSECSWSFLYTDHPELSDTTPGTAQT